MRTDTPKSIYLKDYQPPAFLVDHLDLSFRIHDDRTEVVSRAQYRRNPEGRGPLRLNGEHLKLMSLRIDDADYADYETDDVSLTLNPPSDAFLLEVTTEIDPASNTRLEGLYQSGGNWCTQCEAEGFRTITYYQDRPDVLTTFTTRIEADRDKCPVLLSNGNLLSEGKLADNRHFTLWNDPFPKPCYLFALVAGDLVHIRDSFTTRSGREVDLRIYVRDGDQGQCQHAMASLIHSMRWDEEKYGREYEFDRFNIVAVSDFNMGAMENTSLNIFNTALVLAHPETATDTDFERVESVIAHEYFHNWTGNRVTCRDWFQLSLKEGLTVFRDQEFGADMNSRSVARIDDVQLLRRVQFAEDAGPLAHPIRPDNYIEINNFYTVTVYEKGAEVIRMQHTLLGDETYRKGTDLYFERFDGQAVTCEDFVQCMADASGKDLRGQFFRWYNQAGTPEVSARTSYDAEARRLTIELTQALPPTPGQPAKLPMLIPVAVGLVGANGDDLDLGNGETTRILELTEKTQSFSFDNVPSRPVPSILRNFSAPVRLNTNLSDDDLRFLMVHDKDGFNRWESGQIFATRIIGGLLDRAERGEAFTVPEAILDAYSSLVEMADDPQQDRALLARALTLPDLQVIGQGRAHIYPHAIHRVREAILSALAEREKHRLVALYEATHDTGDFSTDFPARSRRAFKNNVLRILSKALDDSAEELAAKQYHGATNMTDRVGALTVLADRTGQARTQAFEDFAIRFKDYPLVMDKWFSLQAMAVRPSTLEDVNDLRSHADFNIRNPNRVRSLYSAFAMNNPVCFHERSGGGYRFLCDAILELNRINPQIASRQLTPMRDWRRYEPELASLMKSQLERIASVKELSADVYEVVTKSLSGA